MEEEEALYDEFGNYIGPELSDEGSDSGSDLAQDDDEGAQWEDELEDEIRRAKDSEAAAAQESKQMDLAGDSGTAIVLHEDKQYYKSASDVYGEDVEVVIGDEDAMAITVPILAPSNGVKFSAEVKQDVPELSFKWDFVAGMMDHPTLTRAVAVIGGFHHGKSSLMDIFVKATHKRKRTAHLQARLNEKDVEDVFYRYTDTRIDERERELSVKCTPMTLVLPANSGKSHLMHLYDTPGHPNFSDEQTAALRVCDGAVVVVDAAEGVMLQTKKSIQHALQNQLPLVLCISKVDRLVLELKVPPKDAYHKLKFIVEEVNGIVRAASGGKHPTFHPAKGNVCFASGTHNWLFTLESFARSYSNYYQNFNPKTFAKTLWGDVYMHPKKRTFHKEPVVNGQERTFVQFVLNPLYKVYAHVVGSEGAPLKETLKEVGVRVSDSELNLDARPLLSLVLSRMLGGAAGFTSMCVEHLPSPVTQAPSKVQLTYTGAQTSAEATAMSAVDGKGPLVCQTVKVYARSDGKTHDVFARVLSGTIKVWDQVRVLGPGYTPQNTEDSCVCEVNQLWVFNGRYRVMVNQVSAGNWVLIGGIDNGVTKTATIVSADDAPEDVCVFTPLVFNTRSTFKVAIEPVVPAELPKMLTGIRHINKTYPLVTTKKEDSGEHVLLGTGELYLDCILRDLRQLYSGIELRVADPMVKLCETVLDTSSMRCSAETAPSHTQLGMVAEPLDRGLAEKIEQGEIPLKSWTPKQVSTYLKEELDWDVLAARNLWSFGPDEERGPNLLMNDTLRGETDRKALNSVRDGIVQGFTWATNEGPLCEEPMRNVKVKLLSAQISQDSLHRVRGRVIPTARRCVYNAMLMATPRLMEPVYLCEILCPEDTVDSIHKVLNRRRGHVHSTSAKAGTPLHTVQAYVPLLESFGLETDIRTFTMGQASVLSQFDHWDIVPGDPLDDGIILKPLERSMPEALARELMIKTRRRKGLSEDVTAAKFHDQSMVLALAKREALEEGSMNL